MIKLEETKTNPNVRVEVIHPTPININTKQYEPQELLETKEERTSLEIVKQTLKENSRRLCMNPAEIDKVWLPADKAILISEHERLMKISYKLGVAEKEVSLIEDVENILNSIAFDDYARKRILQKIKSSHNEN